MFQLPDQNVLSIKNSNEFKRYLKTARSHFVSFFDSKEQFEELSPSIENQIFNYAYLCQLIPEDLAKLLILSVIKIIKHAYTTDKNKTIEIMTMAARDFDASAVKNAHLKSEYEQVLKNRSQVLPRDLTIKMMNNIEGLIEGVLKKRFWLLPACNDIVNKVIKAPERWQNDDLGKIIRAVKSLPIPVGEALGGDPISGISLNQLRNIGAHKDFEIKENKIVLRTSKMSRIENIDTLFTVLDDLYIRLAIITIVLRLTFTKHLDEITEAGYVTGAYLPENSTTTIASRLAENGIDLQNIEFKDGVIFVNCRIQESTLNPIDALNICFGNIFLIQGVFWGTFRESPDDIFKIIIKKRNETASLTVSRIDWQNLIQNKLDYPITIQYSMGHDAIFLIYDTKNQRWRHKLGTIGSWNAIIKNFFTHIGVKPKILRYWQTSKPEYLEVQY